MSVKILGGIARGFPLAIPKTDTTRPTSVLIKRKLFDWRQHLDDYVFIDLCAGSGAMGFEALSRGAQRVLLNDANRSALHTLKDNKDKIEKAFKFDPSMVKVTTLDARAWVSKELSFEVPDSSNAILFFDPPYEDHKLYFEVLAALKAAGFVGEVWAEADRLKGPKAAELTGAFHSVIKTVEQGDHFVVVGKLV